jgi:hypothetical protein
MGGHDILELCSYAQVTWAREDSSQLILDLKPRDTMWTNKSSFIPHPLRRCCHCHSSMTTLNKSFKDALENHPLSSLRSKDIRGSFQWKKGKCVMHRPLRRYERTIYYGEGRHPNDSPLD